MEGNKSCVSVGLPLFNAERHLSQALDSILSQTYPNLEVIISDNASTDRTQEICLAYARKDQRIRYHRNDKNLGVAPNFNRVLEISSSEYHKWAPHDDLLAPDFVKRCVQILDENPAVVLCYSRAKIIDEYGNFEVDYNPGPDTSSPKPHERFSNWIFNQGYCIQQMGLIRTNVLKKIGGLESYPSSDEVLLAGLALHGQFYEIPERLYLYRRHSMQSSTIMPIRRERVVYFDTSFQGKIVFPTWLYFLGCIRAIKRVPICRNERLRCWGHMIHWLLLAPNFRAMSKDVLLVAKLLFQKYIADSSQQA